VLGGGLKLTPLRFALSAADKSLGGRFSGASPASHSPFLLVLVFPFSLFYWAALPFDAGDCYPCFLLLLPTLVVVISASLLNLLLLTRQSAGHGAVDPNGMSFPHSVSVGVCPSSQYVLT
jgi:hypothetical protein